MTDAAPPTPADCPAAETAADLAQALARVQALQAAATLAPLDWHFVSVLAQRAQTETGAVQARLMARLSHGLDALQARLNTPAREATAPAPATASPLAELLHAMGVALPAPAHANTPAGRSAPAAHSPVLPSPRPELKSVGRMRKTLSRLKVRQQVSQALAQPPEHAGPINSQMLVLRSLALMQDISPEYLHRFMSHVDALMTLEDAQRLPAPGQAVAKNASKPPRPAKTSAKKIAS